MIKIVIKNICALALLFVVLATASSMKVSAGIDWNKIWDEAVKNFITVDDNFDYINSGSSATVVGNKVIQVTQDKQTQRGTIWAKRKLDMTQNWSTEMNMFLGFNLFGGNTNGDGMAFVLQNDPRGKDAIGDFGERLGVWGVLDTDNYIKNGWAVEFDIYANTSNEDNTFDGSIYGDNSSKNYGHIANSYTKVEGNWYNINGKQKFEMTHDDTILPQNWGDRLTNGMIKDFNVSWNASTQEITYTVSYYDLINQKTVTYGKVTKKLDISKFGSTMLNWGFTGSTGYKSAPQFVGFKSIPKTINVDVFPKQTYVGVPLKIDNSNLDDYIKITSGDDVKVDSIANNVDYSKPNKGSMSIQLEDKYGNHKSADIPVVVKEDKTRLDLQDVNLYVGQHYDIDSVFKNVTDKDGNPIKASSVEWYYIDEAKTKTLDTSKPGKHKVRIVYLNAAKKWKYSDSCTVTVKDDKSSIQTKNTTLQIGQTWDKESNFVSATDEDGISVPWSDGRITSNDASVDSSKAGVTKLKYTYNGKVKNTDSEFTVTVEDPLKLIVPSTSDFGTYKLGSSDSVLNWNKSSKVEVEGSNSSQWDLSVALNAKSSLKGYIKIGDQTISDQPQEVISGTGSMDVTGGVSSDNFIKVDYTGVKQLRKDTGDLEWTLAPSTKEVSE